MLGDDADALDATQDTLVSALKALGRFDGRSAFGTWLYRIATNTCIDEMRRRRRRPMTGVGSDVADTVDTADRAGTTGTTLGSGSFGAPGLFVVPASRGNDPADIAAARVDVDVALASLPLEFRTAVVLRDVCDLPYDEIAEILGVPVGTVRSRIARARSALAATWHGEEPGNRSGPPLVRTADEPRGPEPHPARSQEEERTQ